MNRSLEFIYYDSDVNLFTLTAEGSSLLKEVESSKKDILVVSIIGAARTGKSTLLNLLTETNCFVTSNSTEPCTLGLNAVYARDQSIIYIDTQGLFDGKVDDEKLIALCALMSDVCIYNVPQVIDSRNISNIADGVRLAVSLYALPSGTIIIIYNFLVLVVTIIAC